MPKLTVLIPCKDEAHNIRECIESVRSIADEILIADSGSTDGTLNALHAHAADHGAVASSVVQRPARRTVYVEPETRLIYVAPEGRLLYAQPGDRTLEAA